MNAPAPKKTLWPRVAIGPHGNRATFQCMGDVPAGWTLEKPLPGDAFIIEDVYAVNQTDAPKNKGGRPRKVAS